MHSRLISPFPELTRMYHCHAGIVLNQVH
jgi:hypothetical protein